MGLRSFELQSQEHTDGEGGGWWGAKRHRGYSSLMKKNLGRKECLYNGGEKGWARKGAISFSLLKALGKRG